MKQTVCLAIMLGMAPTAAFAQRVETIVAGPEFVARMPFRDRDELKPLAAEYKNIVDTRLRPLTPEGITNLFGHKLESRTKLLREHTRTNGVVLPLFEPDTIFLSGLLVTNDQAHADLYAVGDVEFFYHWDGKTLGGVALYFRPGDGSVPSLTADDFANRLEWEKVKFAAFKKWLDDHAPKPSDQPHAADK